MKKYPKLSIYNDLMQAIDTIDTKQIRNITMPKTYSLFMEEIKDNLKNGKQGYEMYKRMRLGSKMIFFCVENENISYFLYKTMYPKNTVLRDEKYRTLIFKNSLKRWRITNYHGLTVIGKLLTDPLILKQILPDLPQ